ASAQPHSAAPVPQQGLLAMARVPAPARSLLPRRHINIRRIATADLPLKLTAVLIAMIFWAVSALSAPPTEVVRDYGGRVAVERPDAVPAGYVLEGQLGDVGVKLRGTEAALANVVASDIHASLDLSAADVHRADPQDIPVRVDVATAGVKVDSKAPATVTVRIEPITSRDVAVQARFANSPPEGTFAGDPAITPAQVRVSGAASRIARIAALYATVRFGDAVTDLVATVQPTAVVKTTQATVTFSIAPLIGSRAFPVVALQATGVGSGFVAEFDPPTISVVVAGSIPALSGITAGQVVATVDATGKGPGTYPVDVGIRTPAGTTAQSVQPTRVTLTIRTR